MVMDALTIQPTGTQQPQLLQSHPPVLMSEQAPISVNSVQILTSAIATHPIRSSRLATEPSRTRHDFFANRSVNADSTVASMLRAQSSAAVPSNNLSDVLGTKLD